MTSGEIVKLLGECKDLAKSMGSGIYIPPKIDEIVAKINMILNGLGDTLTPSLPPRESHVRLLEHENNKLDRVVNALDKLVEKFCKEEPSSHDAYCPHCGFYGYSSSSIIAQDSNWIGLHAVSNMIGIKYQCHKCDKKFVVHYQATSVEKL